MSGIPALLSKMEARDKDFRYMATKDLMAELAKLDYKMDERLERQVVTKVLALIKDQNGEVQHLAVQSLPELVPKLQPSILNDVVTNLCKSLLSEEELRDITSIALKSTIMKMPGDSHSAASASTTLTANLLTALADAKAPDTVVIEILEILATVFQRFGVALVDQHPAIIERLIQLLTHLRSVIRKRSATALAALSPSLSDDVFTSAVTTLIGKLTANIETSEGKTVIQTLTTINREVGSRLGPFLDDVVQLIVQSAAVEDNDDLREECLQAFESYARQCPMEFSGHVEVVMALCLEYLSYDPNYSYDSDDEDFDDFEDDEDDDEIDDDDDDDQSWKVRRASAKCLSAITGTRPDLLLQIYKTTCPKIVAQFKEREENVRIDVFNAFVEVLKQTMLVLSSDGDMVADDSELTLLAGLVPDVVRILSKQLQDKSAKVRQGALHVLTTLAKVQHNAFAGHFADLVPGIEACMSDVKATTGVKLDTLGFLRVSLETHEPPVFRRHVTVLVKVVEGAVGDSFYKISSESLSVCERLVGAIRPSVDDALAPEFGGAVRSLYECVVSRLDAQEIDQEVREKAIVCTGALIARTGDELASELPAVLPIILSKLQNEVTRVTASKALAAIANSPLQVDLSPILNDALKALASFLRKNNRPLRIATLTTLNVLIRTFDEKTQEELCGLLEQHSVTTAAQNTKRRRVTPHKGQTTDLALFEAVLSELPALIAPNDLHTAQLAVSVMTAVIVCQPTFAPSLLENDGLRRILQLTESPLLHGGALEAVLTFFRAALACNAPNLAFQDVVQMLIKRAFAAREGVVSKQVYSNIAKCVARITIPDAANVTAMVQQFRSEIAKGAEVPDASHLLSLFAVGEIGKQSDLSGHADILAAVLADLQHSSEDVKMAAAFAVGSIAVGNLAAFLPQVLAKIKAKEGQQYLLFHALKEVIATLSGTTVGVQTLGPFVKEIWGLLLDHCESELEGTRNVVAECLGKLCIVDPTTLLPSLAEKLSSESPLARCTVATAVKFTLSDKTSAFDSILKTMLPAFLNVMTDSEHDVRRVGIVALSSAARNKPHIIRDMLPDVLPALYAQTDVDQSLITIKEIGPFKHKQDNGLDLRKSAFECMFTLLDTCAIRLDRAEFMAQVRKGLADHYDIQMLTFLMLVKLGNLFPEDVLSQMDSFVKVLEKTLLQKPKKGIEASKLEEVKASAVRAVRAFRLIKGSEKNRSLSKVLETIASVPALQAKLDALEQQSGRAAEAPPMEL